MTPEQKILFITSFPNCCGIHVINGFGATNTIGRTALGVTPAKAKKDLERIVKETTVGLLMVALNNEQKTKFHDTMIETGFQEIVQDFYHAGHGHTISLYANAVNGTGMRPDMKPRKTKESVFQKCDDIYY